MYAAFDRISHHGVSMWVLAQVGGGIHGHPDGTAAGARALRQAVDAYQAGVPLSEYGEDHEELGVALEKWDTAR